MKTEQVVAATTEPVAYSEFCSHAPSELALICEMLGLNTGNYYLAADAVQDLLGERDDLRTCVKLLKAQRDELRDHTKAIFMTISYLVSPKLNEWNFEDIQQPDVNVLQV